MKLLSVSEPLTRLVALQLPLYASAERSTATVHGKNEASYVHRQWREEHDLVTHPDRLWGRRNRLASFPPCFAGSEYATSTCSQSDTAAMDPAGLA